MDRIEADNYRELAEAFGKLDATVTEAYQDRERYRATLQAIIGPLKAATTSLSPLSRERILITTALELINDSLKIRQ